MEPEEAAVELRKGDWDAGQLTTGSNHVMGTMPMGVDPAKGAATDHLGKVYGTEGLYVCDTSLYPCSPGVNPQLTAMALAHRLGQALPSIA